MFNPKIFFLVSILIAIIIGLCSYFIYNIFLGSTVLSIIIGVAVALFISVIAVLFAGDMRDQMRYQLELDAILQSLEERRRRRWYNRIFWWFQKMRGK